MRDLLKGNGHFIGRIEITQFGSAFMGVTLTLTTAGINDWLFLLASLFTSVFFFSLLYTAFWDKGAKDALQIQGGRAPYQPLKGLWLSLVANIPSIILGILILVGAAFAEETVVEEIVFLNWASNLHSITVIIFRVWNCMYWGILNIFKYLDVAHILMLIPSIVISALGYYAGVKNFHLMEYLHLAPKEQKNPASHRETRL